MMISPETFYDMELAGKSIRDIKKVVNDLKQEMKHLVHIMESPGYRPMMRPDESTRLSCIREYLAKAIEALKEKGGRYELTKEEQKAAEFDENIPYIQKIVYATNSFFGGDNTYTMDLSEEAPLLKIKLWGFEEEDRDNRPIEDRPDKQEFLQALSRLHMGEWQNRYDPHRFGYVVCDGTQWELQVFYSNGKETVTIEGDNVWPHNFQDFVQLMGIEYYEGEPDDEEW